MLDPRQDTGHLTSGLHVDTRGLNTNMIDIRNYTLDVGHCLHWTQKIGYWALRTRHWTLQCSCYQEQFTTQGVLETGCLLLDTKTEH